jgi:hypothetical protein
VYLKKWVEISAAIIALSLFVIGGLLIMTGLILIGVLGTQDMWGWGDARGIGYMAFAIGIFLSIFGVLIMRIMRNRNLPYNTVND